MTVLDAVDGRNRDAGEGRYPRFREAGLPDPVRHILTFHNRKCINQDFTNGMVSASEQWC